MVGDFNKLNGFTLGDAIYVAQMWAGDVEMTTCLDADFNGVNGFTVGDAIFIAQVWAGEAVFPWSQGEGRRNLREADLIDT